ncbi:MAG: 3-hydroxyacyl-CoA dehydrogenase [Thermodesulfobacteriota bacterium]|nr:3-hydroxyacyl-CoA dehydrogenase [Thermodesulfobacteriota bacterium]
MQISDIKKVLILGAGTMGHQIGFLCATHNYDVTLYDISEESLNKALKRLGKFADRMTGRNGLSAEAAAAALDRIHSTTDPEEAAQDTDIVSESVPEDPGLKGKVFARFNDLCPEHTIFTTNTSTLVPSMFAHATGRPERLVALHFHDISLTNIVDVMPHAGTLPAVTGRVKAFAESIGQIPIVLSKENPGYVFNAMLSEWFKSAQTLAANGVAEPRDVDRAWMGVMHAPVGPFGVMDTVGLDTVWKITDFWAEKLQEPQARRNAAFMKQFVDQGKLGIKTGHGVYQYPDPEWANPDFIKDTK